MEILCFESSQIIFILIIIFVSSKVELVIN